MKFPLFFWVLGFLFHLVLCEPLATITPCPAAPSQIARSPITVTRQHQSVSTCEVETSCFWRRCKTRYHYHTYAFVSTVIPDQDGSSTTTITRTDQSVMVSLFSQTLTRLTTSPTVSVARGTPTGTMGNSSIYTTVIKQWNAAYKDLGPLAIPGYSGSGLCHTCLGPNGMQSQVLNVIECVHSPRKRHSCKEGSETWIFQPNPTVKSAVSAVCSSKTSVQSAGVYTFAFPQRVKPIKVPVPAQTITVTVTVGQRPNIVTTTIAPSTRTFPGREWTAFITRSCRGPTLFDFTVTVTKTIFYTVPPYTVPPPT